MSHATDDELQRDLKPAPEGHGPLLQRDYWAVIDQCCASPGEIGRILAERFTEFPPPELVRFERRGGGDGPLEVGDEIDVHIHWAGDYAVRVVHRDAQSLTVATLEGHPEAGRITFGAYRNPQGDVVFHIRSRARAGSRTRYLGFLAGGDPMQTNTWTDFINRFALCVGEGVTGYVHASKNEVEERPTDEDPFAPTFEAR